MIAVTGSKEAAAALDPFELAGWMERPEIRRALDAREEVRDIRLRDKIAAATELAVDRMTAVLDASTDLKDPAQLVETRRASSSIFRLSASFNRAGYAGLRATLRSTLRPQNRSGSSPIAHRPSPPDQAGHQDWEYSPDCGCEDCDARIAAQRQTALSRAHELTGSRAQDSAPPGADSGLRTQGPGLRTQDSGHRTQDPRTPPPLPRPPSPSPATAASPPTTP